MAQDRRDQGTVNFEVYEGATRFLGIASATLPDLSYLTSTMTGAGISGNITTVYAGQMDEMSLTLTFRNLQREAASLMTPEIHTLELRSVYQVEDPINRTIEYRVGKHVFSVMPKKLTGGNIAPASTGDPSGEYAVRYWAYYVDGDVQFEIDPANSICKFDGTDYLADLRTALGY